MTILVVDDEEDTRNFLRDLLVHAGRSVTTAGSAAAAMVHVHLQQYDLILLDIMMPGIDGHQLAQFLTSHWNTFDIPIVVISCRKDAESKSWAKLNGCVGYIEKPFSPVEILETIEAIERKGEKAQT